jgi:hypothetical protein
MPGLRLLVPTRVFDSEEAVGQHLLNEDADGERYLYRGQSRDFRRRWPQNNGPFRPLTAEDLADRRCWRIEDGDEWAPRPLSEGLFDLPSLIPTDTRRYENFLRDPSGQYADDAFDEVMVRFHTIVCQFIVGLACLVEQDVPTLNWLRRLQQVDPPGFYRLRSIGQHYGMDTGLLDATSSVSVALWFATHDFETGRYRARDAGVIYRIDRQCLGRGQEWLRTHPDDDWRFDAQAIDIRDTPGSIAPRAARQQGWSVTGLEHPRLLIRLVADGGLQAYTFSTGLTPSAANPLRREDLVPSQDPVASLFTRFWSPPPRSLADVQDWMVRHWASQSGAMPIQVTNDFDWLTGLPAIIGPALDRYVTEYRAARPASAAETAAEPC